MIGGWSASGCSLGRPADSKRLVDSGSTGISSLYVVDASRVSGDEVLLEVSCLHVAVVFAGGYPYMSGDAIVNVSRVLRRLDHGPTGPYMFEVRERGGSFLGCPRIVYPPHGI